MLREIHILRGWGEKKKRQKCRANSHLPITAGLLDSQAVSHKCVKNTMNSRLNMEYERWRRGLRMSNPQRPTNNIDIVPVCKTAVHITPPNEMARKNNNFSELHSFLLLLFYIEIR